MPEANTPPLSSNERVFYRDRLRAARYAALADAEGFQQTCYALEALGMRLLGREATLDAYRDPIQSIASVVPSLSTLPVKHPKFFTRFYALYEVVRRARNDVMHGGVYARHATGAAIELCIGLEEAVMTNTEEVLRVRDLMIKTPVIAEVDHPLAYVRHQILTHSFSFLPVWHKRKWSLVSEMSLAIYLRSRSTQQRKTALAQPLSKALSSGLALVPSKQVGLDQDIASLFGAGEVTANPVLWLVRDSKGKLVGVLSPFELI